MTETAFEEHQSSKLLSDYVEKQGFSVEKGVADIPTAFIASYGNGSPVIGILDEFDALPRISRKVLTATRSTGRRCCRTRMWA